MMSKGEQYFSKKKQIKTLDKKDMSVNTHQCNRTNKSFVNKRNCITIAGLVVYPFQSMSALGTKHYYKSDKVIFFSGSLEYY